MIPMNRSLRSTRLFAVVTCFALAGCSEGDKGTAPTISAFSLDDATVQVGAVETLDGSVAFVDPDGDLSSVEIEMVTPSGGSVMAQAAVVNAEGVTEGTSALQVPVQATEAGTHSLFLVAMDSEGNTSNELEATFEAEEP
jgi:hypothetical protein